MRIFRLVASSRLRIVRVAIIALSALLALPSMLVFLDMRGYTLGPPCILPIMRFWASEKVSVWK
jgi:hypothetical protein